MTTKERPILFSAPMVRAILDGKKTQTRRPVKHIPEFGNPDEWCHRTTLDPRHDYTARHYRRYCPYGELGTILWVRETWRGLKNERGSIVQYRASAKPDKWADANLGKWKPSIFMPRWASRLTLEITDVRVERVLSISEEDARAEGVEPRETTDGDLSHALGFIDRWDEMYAKKPGLTTDDDPWAWVVEFKRVEER